MLIGKKRIEAHGSGGRITIARREIERVGEDGRIDVWIYRRTMRVGPDQPGRFVGNYRAMSERGRIGIPREVLDAGILRVGCWARIEADETGIIISDIGGKA